MKKTQILEDLHLDKQDQINLFNQFLLETNKAKIENNSLIMTDFSKDFHDLNKDFIDWRKRFS